MQADKLLVGRFDRPDDDYGPILRFARECNHIRYSEFDAQTIRRLNLFALRENFDFNALEETLDRIVKTLPAIKRIFAKPIIRLKDSPEIMPVESVRVVNNKTIVHAALHSELWDGITEDGLKPRKLLTLNHEDQYAIYENIAFVRAIDLIMQLVGKNIRLLRDMLYIGRDLKFNLLERENHLAYFLAIGKLHIGYVRDYDKYCVAAERCLDKLLYIDRTIRLGLGSPIYKHCKQSGKFTLKKTNVFRSHKDYHRIYLLLKWFADAKIDDAEPTRPTETDEGYRTFCSLLAIFAAGHFNFAFPEDEEIDFFDLNINGVFEGWKLKLETLTCGAYAGIRFTLVKDYTYRVVLLPTTDPERGREVLIQFRAHFDAEEYLLAAPIEEERRHIYLDLHDIESFRRLQQVLMRAMIYSDAKRDSCPFCGRQLVSGEDREEEVYECASCRTQILHLTCPDRGRAYFATQINHFRAREADPRIRRDKLLYGRYIEAQMHFRNITAIGDRLELICPQCGHSHG